ncbi:diguanylate cyclase [Maricurvus nonylphenolicus]|uniref:GGDEF domain-containing protein n=1 Tax=Maricurvus nonylphenolicus TaxID=1008307 RepID=UPI0036F34743
MLQQLRAPLFKRLILSLLLAFSVVLSARLFVRIYWEIPQYLSMEMQSDQRAAARVESALESRIGELITLFLPSSAWDEMHHYALEPNQAFIDTYYNTQDWSASFTDGVFLLNLKKDILWQYQSSSLKQAADSAGLNQQAIEALARAQASGPNALSPENFPAGLSQSFEAPLAFVSLPIYPNNYNGEVSGFIVAWDYLDSDTRTYLQDILQTDFTVTALTEGEPIPPDLFADLKRNNQDRIRWSIDDHKGEPAFVAELHLAERRFNDNLINLTTVIEAVVALITFALLAQTLTRYIISPIRTLRNNMETIHQTRDYSARINSHRSDEFGELSREYDALLEHIQHQESALRASNNELLQLSNMDALTGIANRRAFDSFLQNSQDLLPVSLLLMDIDHFKQYNDHYGHQAGDNALQAVATALHRNSHSSTDLVARYGGEEFAIVLTGTPQRQARQVAERVLNAVRKLGIEHALSNHKCVTLSIGIATAESNFSAEELIKQADDALYDAKDQGRNRVCVLAS